LVLGVFENFVAIVHPDHFPCPTFVAYSTVLVSIFITKKRFVHLSLEKSTTVKYFVFFAFQEDLNDSYTFKAQANGSSAGFSFHFKFSQMFFFSVDTVILKWSIS
jgi:hypothetical protein